VWPICTYHIRVQILRPSQLKHYLNLRNETRKSTFIKYVLSHANNYQHVSITFATTIRVALQQYKEYYKLANCENGTPQSHYNRLKFYNLCTVMEHINNIYLIIHSFICLHSYLFFFYSFGKIINRRMVRLVNIELEKNVRGHRKCYLEGLSKITTGIPQCNET